MIRAKFPGICLLLALAAAPGLFLPGAAHAGPCPVEHVGKLGTGAWPVDGENALQADLARLHGGWFYTWQAKSGLSDPRFVPMIRSGRDLPQVFATASPVLLTFNEPDEAKQANMSVELALAYWPTLMATGKRLGSPATGTGNELGPDSWLGRFMAGAGARGYRVDFIAVHHYAQSPDIDAFRRRLERIHAAYDRPIWVTEWALADWTRPGRFSVAEQASFFRRASAMLDDLPFVERHAWFGLYEGLDGWNLHSGLVADGRLTEVGRAFVDLATCEAAPDDPE
ncbi:glycosyl hydrolase [Novosphingobium sp. KN65.2]|uniref:glycosyl hydrolase n=1 Tax=Novosphingobium sp. KN65.2 TaxID=1478134 RepID=UPI0005E21F9D|nr:glycosyl hydrolase [Novosphingobium sp. KN65.2]CDO36268.1 exported hypothetical protein [Novosphingobium sp. KN65.2]